MILFFTDPHLGLERASHTTPRSRQVLKNALVGAVERVFELAGETKPGTPVFCLGDLFDRSSNAEDTLLQGMRVVERCTAVLAGNHDVPANANTLTSLGLLQELSLQRDNLEWGQVALAPVGETSYLAFLAEPDDTSVVLVPHVASQDLLEQALQEVLDIPFPGRFKLLCLHVNYAAEEHIQSDASLHLSRENAEILLEKFDYILIGHEHQPRTDFDGRVRVLGNTHPTSFADIGPKYVWAYSAPPEAPAPVFFGHLLWSPELAKEYSWEEFMAASFEEMSQIQFLEITGEAEAAVLPPLAERISQAWRNCPALLMLRNNVTCLSPIWTPEQAEEAPLTTLPERISSALQGTDLLPLWQAYLARADAEPLG